ncbi:MAG: DUF1425 domain-containing protein [Phycisphaeraceae bacterium]|nr:DUF1425 domain-containing protein [Phycisphaeraceae bacterium]
MSTMKIRTLLAVAIASVLLAACKPGPPPSPQAEVTQRANYPRNIALQGLSPSLLAGEAMIEAPKDNRPLHVTVPIRNVYAYGVNVQYRFEFFDATGKPVAREEPGWRFQHLATDMQAFLDGNAMDMAAVDWRLTIRSAR